ncbi:MAG: family 10 glycosylhydrolase, partial [Cyanobacteria bacterium J06649_4]
MPLKKQITLRGSFLLPALLANVVLNSLGVSIGKESAIASTGSALFALPNNVVNAAEVLFDRAAHLENETIESSVDADLDIFSGLPTTQEIAQVSALWESKEVRGIYMSRYQITNRASEQTIRDRVRYYKSQGINTIIHGVWGNGCTMYRSAVMSKTFGTSSCPNEFQDQWLDWLIDEAHAQGMQVHAYFEKGIKLDRNSPIYNHARTNGWFVQGVDRTYAEIDHYVLDVDNPAVSSFFEKILAEFVSQYPTVDAVQWDDYLGYHSALPGSSSRT